MSDEAACAAMSLGPAQVSVVALSVRLPNGRHVTFGFVPGTTPDDFEWVDINSTVGAHWKDKSTVGEDHYEQKLVGFAKGGDTFDTRKHNRSTMPIAASELRSQKHRCQAGSLFNTSVA